MLQAALPPHVHVPDAEQPSAEPPHVAHIAPSVPQVAAAGAWQMAPVQQPVGQEAESHTHAPLTQVCPVPHAGPGPQVQAPARQPSAVVFAQDVQAAPPLPQTASVVAGEVHLAPEQQPSGHDDALQTQTPPEHSWPVAQAAPLPHEQSPAAEQLSAWPGPHATHPFPPKPHADSERALHVGPEQQPVGHAAAQPLHVPRVQVWLPGQLWQDAPPLPHAATLSPDSQTPDAQHPVGHDPPSHTHVPLRQRCPAAQAAPVPQLQTPAAEQLSVVSASHGLQVAPGTLQAEREVGVHVAPSQQPSGQDVTSQVQAPAEQCCPGPQGAPLPQWQAPALQLSDWIASHGKHEAPPVPHWAAEGVLQVEPVQHPLGQEVASHTQRPPAQRCPPSHAGLPPHEHWPVVEQASAVAASHWTQATALTPQDAKADIVHVIPLQQPSGQAQLVQAPPVQASPVRHAEHARPALPQALGVLPGWQTPFAQQPFGQEVLSHVHEPARHRCPVSHAAVPPQRQSPPAEQESLVVWLQAVHTQDPPTHCWLGVQGGPLPHEGPVWL